MEGAKLIEEALKNNIQLGDIVISQSYYQDGFERANLAGQLESVLVVSDSLFKGLYTTDTSCGIIATALPHNHSLEDILNSGKTVLLADNIQDPGNLGTIIRTAFAFEAGGIILSKGTVDCYSPKVVRSSMGAIFSLPIVNQADLTTTISQLKEKQFKVLALDAGAKRTIWGNMSTSSPIAYILGNEGHGISQEILNAADDTVSIPINPNCESLNVAIAAGIILVCDRFSR